MTDSANTSKVNELLKGWNPQALSSNAELLDNLSSMTAKSRDLEKSSGIAVSIFETITDKVIGIGLKLIPNIDYRTLDLKETNAALWNETVQRLWNLFINSRDFDVTGKNNGHAMSRLALRSVLSNGEILTLPYWRKEKNVLFNTQFRLVECDRLITPPNKENNKNIKAGIKFNKNGKPIAYFVSKTYPDDDYFTNDLEFQEISAQTEFGRKRVIHTFEQKRADQIRGKAVLYPVLNQFKKLEMYEGAELSAAVVSALIALIVESPEMSVDELAELFGTKDKKEVYALKKEWDRGLRDGSIMKLFPGETIKDFNPNRPNAAFAAFIETNVKNICVAAGYPYEMIMKDFSKCNYSSARAALQEGWEKILVTRDWFIQEWVKEIYALFLEEIVNKGYVKAPNFYKYKEAYLRFSVHGPTRGILDPVKEAKAATERLNTGLTTYQYECGALGLDSEDVLERRAIEEEQIKSKGLVFNQNTNSNAKDDEKEESEDE